MKQTTMKKLLYNLFLISFLISCSSDDIASGGNSNCDSSIPFLATGKTYNYTLTVLFAGNNTIKMTFEECNGEDFLIERILTNNQDQSVNYTDLMKQEGDYLLVDSNNDGNYFSKTYKKNAALGDIWTHTKDNGAIVTHEVIAVDSLVTVAAGTFNCKVFKYTSSSTINETFIFWHDDIGNIKEDTGGLFDLELVSYN